MSYSATSASAHPRLMMATVMPGRSFSGPPPPLTSDEQVLAESLRGHIETLAEVIGERNALQYDNLQRAAAYVEEQFLAAGLEVRALPYEFSGKPFYRL